MLNMMSKGWIERGAQSGTYRITAAGNAALRLPVP
jgi:hypothetical protein